MTTTTNEIATIYFDSWQRRDFDSLAGILADGVEFTGSMGQVTGVPDCIRGLTGVRGMVEDIVVVKRWVDGADALTWFELRREGRDPVPTVNWSHVEDGRITRIRVTFDPRPLLG
jgi:ketosteroid isomerase-like protein